MSFCAGCGTGVLLSLMNRNPVTKEEFKWEKMKGEVLSNCDNPYGYELVSVSEQKGVRVLKYKFKNPFLHNPDHYDLVVVE